MIKWDRNCLEKTTMQWRENGKQKTSGTVRVEQMTHQATKQAWEKKKAERSVLPIPILGKKEKIKKQTKNIQHTQKSKYDI